MKLKGLTTASRASRGTRNNRCLVFTFVITRAPHASRSADEKKMAKT